MGRQREEGGREKGGRENISVPDICQVCMFFNPYREKQRVDPETGDPLGDPWGDRTSQDPQAPRPQHAFTPL